MSKPVIKIGGVTVPHGLNKDDLLKFLVENKSILIAEKKSEKKALEEGLTVPIDISKTYTVDKQGNLIKAAAPGDGNLSGASTVLCVINTTNYMDSHSDVHIPGIWKKSLKDNQVFLHLQEHNMSFASVISDESKGYTKTLTWKELGYDITGTTEALIFATPLTGRNPYMEEQYRKGFVKNHSVGMRYVNLKLCVNKPEDEYYKEEFANWQQYSPMVVNIDAAEEQGFFWAVLEAKIIEGSAVVKGSNSITPTYGFKSEPPAGTQQQEPPAGTRVKQEINFEKLAAHLEKQSF